MSLKLVCKQIETQRIEWKEGVTVGVRPFPQSEMVIMPDGTFDLVTTAKRRWLYCLQYVEGLIDDQGEPLDPQLMAKIEVNGGKVTLKEAIFDFPALIGFPIELTRWIQERIDELTYPLGDLSKNLQGSQDGTSVESLASSAEASQSPKDSSPPAESATEDD